VSHHVRHCQERSLFFSCGLAVLSDNFTACVRAKQPVQFGKHKSWHYCDGTRQNGVRVDYLLSAFRQLFHAAPVYCQSRMFKFHEVVCTRGSVLF